jgi:type IV pilus assembly protein PilY1
MYVDTDADDVPDTTITWKLGDVIHSTPITVAQPAENFDLLYRDTTYAEFSKRWINRRHVIYFGANDGMLHAVNGGFFVEAARQFCRALDSSGKQCAASEANTPVLGEELWAYVPYNLLPHLSCLTEPLYGLDATAEHKYFVDLRPRIFDVQIFDKNEAGCSYVDGKPTTLNDPGCIHPNGWGTILVGGMRFGGAPVEAAGFHDGDDNRVFTSAYFIFDITNPETVPTLLGETTVTTTNEDLDDDGVLDPGEDVIIVNGILDGETDLGYTTVIPTVVPMKDGTTTEWSLILGSGPDDLDGTSEQNARLAVIPLHDRMNPSSLKSLRIPAAAPVPPAPTGTDYEDFGTIFVPDTNSFISDLITIDLETRSQYMADIVYFGTVAGVWGDWSGKLNRLVTRKTTSPTSQAISRPHEWPGLLSPLLTNPNVLYDPGHPIVAPPTVATDGQDFWVYFGTGRFFDVDDKTDSSSNDIQTFYGIREPIDCSGLTFGGLNWKTVTNAVPTGPPAETAQRGDIGLLPVEDIAIQLLQSSASTNPGVVGCYNREGAVDFDPGIPIDGFNPNIDLCCDSIPADHPLRTNRSFDDLQQYITGLDVYCYPGTSPGFDGWSKDMLNLGERNLGQATLLGGLLSYSTYIPNTDICSPEGSGYLYGIYYQTGTSWFEDVFGRSPVLYNEPINEGIFLGAGLSTTPNIHVGEQEGGKAFIQTSVGQIVEIPQPNLPIKNYKSGRVKWMDIE